MTAQARTYAPDLPEPATASEPTAAKLIGCSTSTLARAIRDGRPHPPFYVVGARRRYFTAEVVAWLTAQRVEASAP